MLGSKGKLNTRDQRKCSGAIVLFFRYPVFLGQLLGYGYIVPTYKSNRVNEICALMNRQFSKSLNQSCIKLRNNIKHLMLGSKENARAQ